VLDGVVVVCIRNLPLDECDVEGSFGFLPDSKTHWRQVDDTASQGSLQCCLALFHSIEIETMDSKNDFDFGADLDLEIYQSGSSACHPNGGSIRHACCRMIASVQHLALAIPFEGSPDALLKGLVAHTEFPLGFR
jgi:hypothetical protein